MRRGWSPALIAGTRPRQQGQVNWPTYYADWLTVPATRNLAQTFFSNIYSEVRDVAACGEWCPFADVAGSISRAVQMAKRTMDSLVMTTIFTHEQLHQRRYRCELAGHPPGRHQRSCLVQSPST